MDLARSYDGSAGFPHWILAKVQDQARGRRVDYGLVIRKALQLP